MTARGDPYGVLGVPPGASLADVKRAYRLLAKRHHPDAGEGSVTRFLEVQAAYDVLVRAATAGPARPDASRPPGRRPAQQAPRTTGARRASEDRPGDSGTPPPPPPGTEWARRPRDDRGRAAAGAGATGERGRRGRGPRKATLGSTTYDEAGEIRDPTWQGADWYGPASGTYWTVNPKEYADPRKHGPEYMARWAARPGGTSGSGTSGSGTSGTGRSEPGSSQSAAPGPRPEGAAASAPGFAQSRVAAEPARAARTSARRQPRGADPAWPRPLERLVIGGLGWLPLGALLAVAVGLPGGFVATLPLQVAGLAGMLWAPRLAWTSSGGLAAAIALGIPGIAVLAALGVAIRPGGPVPIGLVVLAGIGWCAGAMLAAGGRLVAPPWRARP